MNSTELRMLFIYQSAMLGYARCVYTTGSERVTAGESDLRAMNRRKVHRTTKSTKEKRKISQHQHNVTVSSLPAECLGERYIISLLEYVSLRCSENFNRATCP